MGLRIPYSILTSPPHRLLIALVPEERKTIRTQRRSNAAAISSLLGLGKVKGGATFNALETYWGTLRSSRVFAGTGGASFRFPFKPQVVSQQPRNP